jgi:hypothetical protein
LLQSSFTDFFAKGQFVRLSGSRVCTQNLDSYPRRRAGDVSVSVNNMA